MDLFFFIRFLSTIWVLLKKKYNFDYRNESIREKRFVSIVRRIGTFLPLGPASRVNLNLATWNLHNEFTSEENSDVCQYNDAYFEDTCSISCLHRDTKIKQLEEELKELRLQVASILKNQITTAQLNSNIVHSTPLQKDSNLELKLSQSPKPFLPPPPPTLPPPPPPPPPPPGFLTPICTSIRRKRKTDDIWETPKSSRNPTSALSDVLNQLKTERPKLKPIKRSPGGRPIKPPPLKQIPLTDASEILSAVLRKRFNAVQESDSDCDSINNSNEWQTCFS